MENDYRKIGLELKERNFLFGLKIRTQNSDTIKWKKEVDENGFYTFVLILDDNYKIIIDPFLESYTIIDISIKRKQNIIVNRDILDSETQDEFFDLISAIKEKFAVKRELYSLTQLETKEFDTFYNYLMED